MTGLRPNKALFPLAALYGFGVGIRNLFYDAGLMPRYRSALPVICVGNATVGGSGKTPFVQFLAERLKRAGFQPVILSRGYSGKLLGPYRVKSTDTAVEVGDEAISHRDRLRGIAEVVIARRRADGARLIQKEKIGNVIILDDGLQHRALRRDFDILLLDVSSPEAIAKWETGLLLPAGWLREPLSQAIRRSHAVLLVSKGRARPPLPVIKKSSSFVFELLPSTIRDVQANITLPTAVLRGKPVSAAAGIGEPQHFFAMLAALGAVIEVKKEFPDHYHFQQSDLEALQPSAARPLIVTSKDAVKLKNFLSAPGEVYSLELGGGFQNLSQEQEFLKLCREAISRHGTRGREVHDPAEDR